MGSGGLVFRVQIAGRRWYLSSLTIADYVELQQMATEATRSAVLLGEWCEQLAAYLDSSAGKWQWLCRCVVHPDGQRYRWRTRCARWRLYQHVKKDNDAWVRLVLATDGLQESRIGCRDLKYENELRMGWGAVFQKLIARWGWEPAVIGRLTPAWGVELLTGACPSGRIVASSWSEAQRLAELARQRVQNPESQTMTPRVRLKQRLAATFGQFLQWSAPAAMPQPLRLEMPPGEWGLRHFGAEQGDSLGKREPSGVSFELGRERRWARWIARQVVEQLVQESSLTRRVMKR